MKGTLTLAESVLYPSCTNIGGSVIQHTVRFPCLHLFFELRSAAFRRDVVNKCCDIRDCPASSDYKTWLTERYNGKLDELVIRAQSKIWTIWHAHALVVRTPIRHNHTTSGISIITYLIGSRSIPMIREETGMNLAATWHQDPGAAHRSIHTLAFSRNPNFLLSWISLKADRALYPGECY